MGGVKSCRMLVVRWRYAVTTKKIAVVALLCTLVAVGACRREYPCCEPLKLGGPAAEQPAR